MSLLADKYVRLSRSYIQLDERHTQLDLEHVQLKRRFVHLYQQFQQMQQTLSRLQNEHAALQTEYQVLGEFKALLEPGSLQELEEAVRAVEAFETSSSAAPDPELLAADAVIAAYDQQIPEADRLAEPLAGQGTSERLVFEVPSENAA